MDSGLRMDVIWANSQKMVIQTEQQRSEHRKRQENEAESFFGCPKERHCDQRQDQHNHDDEDRGRRSKADAEFTMGKTMHDVDQQASNNNSGRVLS